MFDVQAARARFPALQQTVAGGGHPVFFDNPAGTQVPQDVIDAVTGYYSRMNANSGGVFATSAASDAMVQATREKLARFLNAPRADEIVIGANMTTLNFALSRALAQGLHPGVPGYAAHAPKPGDEIVLTRMDHDANVSPWLRVAEDRGLVVRWVDITEPECMLDLNSLEAALTERTKIVATVHASNAVGTINPVAQIAQMAHAAGALYIVDAVQSAPHIPIDVQA
ncbi:MAG: aminotransferase class V-fold PLP-dependent enzyme, partial [Anaerolineae bacterium]